MAEPITIQKLLDASIDSDTLGEFANEDKVVISRKGLEYPSAPMASRLVVENGLLGATPFSTYAAMTASALVDGDYAIVTNDADATKTGFYQKSSGVWQYLAYNFANIFSSLADNYIAPRGVIPNGADLLALDVAGVYVGAAGAGYINSPTGNSFVMVVASAGSSSDSSSRWIAKTAYDIADSATYSRVDDMLNIDATKEWLVSKNINLGNLKTDSKTVDGAINEVLEKSFLYKASVANPVIKDITETGFFVLTGLIGNTELPSGYVKSSGFIEVKSFGTFTQQKLIPSLNEGHKYYVRTVRYGVATEWIAVGFDQQDNSSGTPYAGKTAVFLGDSITENGDYPARVGARLGLTAINGGFGGTRITEMTTNLAGMCGVDVADAINSGDWSVVRAGAQQRFDDTSPERPDDNRPIVDRLEAVNWLNVDYIVCFWGTNDWSNDVPLGVNADKNRTTIKGAVAYVIDKILSAHPHIKIMFVTPMFRGRIQVGDLKDSDSTPNENGVYLVELGDAIIEQAQRYNIPAFDLYRNCGFNVLNYSTYLRDQTIDGLHPYSTVGHQHLANKISAAFASNF